MWRAEQVDDDKFDLYDPEGQIHMYDWPRQEVEYFLLAGQRVDEYVMMDLSGREETVRLR